MINVQYLRAWLDVAQQVAKTCQNVEEFQQRIDEQMARLYGEDRLEVMRFVPLKAQNDV